VPKRNSKYTRISLKENNRRQDGAQRRLERKNQMNTLTSTTKAIPAQALPAEIWRIIVPAQRRLLRIRRQRRLAEDGRSLQNLRRVERQLRDSN
jgi:hypothetical protein